MTPRFNCTVIIVHKTFIECLPHSKHCVKSVKCSISFDLQASHINMGTIIIPFYIKEALRLRIG